MSGRSHAAALLVVLALVAGAIYALAHFGSGGEDAKPDGRLERPDPRRPRPALVVAAVMPVGTTEVRLRRAPGPGISTIEDTVKVGMKLRRGDTVWTEADGVMLALTTKSGARANLSEKFHAVIQPSSSRGVVAVRAGNVSVGANSPTDIEVGPTEGAILLSAEGTRYGAHVRPAKDTRCFVYEGRVRASWGQKPQRWTPGTVHVFRGRDEPQRRALPKRKFDAMVRSMLHTTVTLEWAQAKARKKKVPSLPKLLRQLKGVMPSAKLAEKERLKFSNWARKNHLAGEALYQAREARQDAAARRDKKGVAAAQLLEAGALLESGKKKEAARLFVQAHRVLGKDALPVLDRVAPPTRSDTVWQRLNGEAIKQWRDGGLALPNDMKPR